MLSYRLLAGSEDQSSHLCAELSGFADSVGHDGSASAKGFVAFYRQLRTVWCSISELSSAPNKITMGGNPHPYHQANRGSDRAVGRVVIGKMGHRRRGGRTPPAR